MKLRKYTLIALFILVLLFSFSELYAVFFDAKNYRFGSEVAGLAYASRNHFVVINVVLFVLAIAGIILTHLQKMLLSATTLILIVLIMTVT